jgi:hypothetical protein
MNPRNTMILALVVAALGAFLYFYEIRGGEKRADAEEAAKHLFQGVSAEEIDAIALTASGGELVRLERSDKGWKITEPVQFPADKIRADGLASSLASLSSEAVFEEPEPLDEYGLGADPTIRFWVGEAEHALYIGDKTPVAGNTYVKTGAGAQVYAVKSYRTSALTKSLDELRDSKILDFDRDAVDRVEASWPGGGVVLEKGEAGWKMLEPVEAPADAHTVDDLLSDLSFLRADGFIDEAPPDAELGLDAPAYRVELVAGAGKGDEAPTRTRLVIGATSDGTYRAVRGSAENLLYQIRAKRLDDFPRTVVAFRLKDLADFDASDAVRFELVFPPKGGEGAPYVVSGQRTEGKWTTTPEPMEAGKASQMITELSKLTAVDIVAEAMGDDELRAVGLSPPAVTLRAFGAGEGEKAPLLAEVYLGEADPERGVAAQRSGDDVVYRLNYHTADRIPISREAFENRFRSSEEPQQPQALQQSQEPQQSKEPQESDED